MPKVGPRAEPWSGIKPPEAGAFVVFRSLMEAANLPTFLQFGNANTL